MNLPFACAHGGRILLSRLIVALVALTLTNTTNQTKTRQSLKPHEFTRRSGHQAGGWNNPKAFPLLVRLEVEAATIRMMEKTGWSKGRCISHALEEGYMSLGFLERPPPSDPSPVDPLENLDGDRYWSKLLAMTTDELRAESAKLNETPGASLSKLTSLAIVIRSHELAQAPPGAKP